MSRLPQKPLAPKTGAKTTPNPTGGIGGNVTRQPTSKAGAKYMEKAQSATAKGNDAKALKYETKSVAKDQKHALKVEAKGQKAIAKIEAKQQKAEVKAQKVVAKFTAKQDAKAQKAEVKALYQQSRAGKDAQVRGALNQSFPGMKF